MADTQILLRHASADDAATIAKLHTLSWQTAYRDILPGQYLEGEVPREHESHWATCLAQPAADRGLVLIAEFTGEPVGFVSAEKRPGSAYGVLLKSLHALKTFQGYGAGKLMIEAARGRESLGRARCICMRSKTTGGRSTSTNATAGNLQESNPAP